MVKITHSLHGVMTESQLFMYELRVYAHILMCKDIKNYSNSAIKEDPTRRVSF